MNKKLFLSLLMLCSALSSLEIDAWWGRRVIAPAVGVGVGPVDVGVGAPYYYPRGYYDGPRREEQRPARTRTTTKTSEESTRQENN